MMESSRAIREVAPLDLPPTVEHGSWTCTRCQRMHNVPDSYAVHFRSNGRRLLFVVCPPCAELYEVPRPVHLDLRRLPPADLADAQLRTVAAHAWSVSRARSRPPENVLRLRDSDVRELARRNSETPEELVRRLDDRGLLATA